MAATHKIKRNRAKDRKLSLDALITKLPNTLAQPVKSELIAILAPIGSWLDSTDKRCVTGYKIPVPKAMIIMPITRLM